MAEIKRVRRTPINGTRNKIPTVKNPDPNFHYRYVYDNAIDNRVETMKEYGYEVVDNNSVQLQTDKRVATPNAPGSVVTVPSGANKLVLMRIPKEYKESDRKEKWAKVDESEAAMVAPKEGLSGTISISRK